MGAVAGDHFNTALQTMRETAKLIRVASRATHCITQGDSRSIGQPQVRIEREETWPPSRAVKY